MTTTTKRRALRASTRALARIVGAELRRLRQREGMSQDDVAHVLKLPRPVVCRRERGKHLPRIEHIAEQARACGGTLAHVLLQLDIANGALVEGKGR